MTEYKVVANMNDDTDMKVKIVKKRGRKPIYPEDDSLRQFFRQRNETAYKKRAPITRQKRAIAVMEKYKDVYEAVINHFNLVKKE